MRAGAVVAWRGGAYGRAMPTRVILLSLALALLAPASALASLADEQRQGAALVTALQSGDKVCGTLSNDDFEHIGEYVMGRALGSTNAHQSMNERMRLMMGDQGEERMHQLMGRRFAGCSSAVPNGAGNAMGPGMMGGYYGHGGWGAMMDSRDWSWMMGGNWRAMSRQDWQRLQQEWFGASTATGAGGWSLWAIAGIAVGTVLLIALAIVAIVRRPFRRPPAAAASLNSGDPRSDTPRQRAGTS
jgi:hypothetical protein